jgi:pantetheine-phosphate adenylyltransferase
MTPYSVHAMKTAIYAGTFDPLTYGHLDLIERCAELFPKLILAVSADTSKQTLFPTEERVAIIEDVVAGTSALNVEVCPFKGLLVNFARQRDVTVMVRGLRAYSDFEYEFQMALTNRKLAPEVETVFMMPKEVHSYISSTMAKEIAKLGGDVSAFVPPAVEAHLRAIYGDPSPSFPSSPPPVT